MASRSATCLSISWAWTRRDAVNCAGPVATGLLVITGGGGNDDISVADSVPASVHVRANGNCHIRGPDLLRHRLGRSQVEVRDDDAGALGGQPLRDRLADTRSATGDEGDPRRERLRLRQASFLESARAR